MFVPPIDPNAAGVRPSAVFLTRFSASGFVRPIPAHIARDLLRATNHLTLELNDFYWYAAAVDLLWPGADDPARGVVEHLTRTTPCYSLGIDRSAGVRAVVEQVLGSTRRPARPAMEGTKTP
jgi:hypothetical protein